MSADSSQAQQLLDDEIVDTQALREVPAEGGDIHRFPRGPNPGTFLHGLLEWAGREGFAEVSGKPDLIKRTVGNVVTAGAGPAGFPPWSSGWGSC